VKCGSYFQREEKLRLIEELVTEMIMFSDFSRETEVTSSRYGAFLRSA
jgi:hypothetical protein